MKNKILIASLSLATLSAIAWDTPTVRPNLPLIFPDGELIAESSGVTLTIHAGVKDVNPVLQKDRPWEKKGCHVYGSVWKMDDGTYRMWYNDWSYSLVADSTDGVTWTKPYLTANSSELYPSNNLCKNASGHCNSLIFDGFETDPARRYKHIGTSYTYNSDWTINTNKTGYYTCYSADGLVFTGYRRALYGWDTVSMTLHPETGDIYCYHKIMTPNIAGKTVKRRVVYLATTSDFDTWSAPQLVLAPDATDDASFEGTDSKRMDIYTHTAFPYAGGFLGLTTMFKIDTSTLNANGETTDYGRSEVELTSSPDGIKWNRTPGRETIISVGEKGNWDCGGIWGIASGEFVHNEQETMAYYYGLDNEHGRKLRSAETLIATGRAVWRRWGFASWNAGNEGTIVTKPLKLATCSLKLNAAPLGEGMRVVVKILDETGKTTLAVANPVTEDATLAALTWENSAVVRTNQPVRIKFELTQAALYALECVGEFQRYTPLERPVWLYDDQARPAEETGEGSGSTVGLDTRGTLSHEIAIADLERREWTESTATRIAKIVYANNSLTPPGLQLIFR